MSNLSPAAQAVLDAATEGFWRTSLNSEGNGAAAALRAAADAVVDAHDGFTGTRIYDSIYAIADELEGQ